MNAITLHGPGDVRVESVPDPRIVDPTDAVLRITTSAVCGSDPHQYHGRVTGLDPGIVMGHEFKDLTLRMGICNARNFITPLMPLIQNGRLQPGRIITHSMPLADAPKGYAIFDRKEDRAIKVMLKP